MLLPARGDDSSLRRRLNHEVKVQPTVRRALRSGDGIGVAGNGNQFVSAIIRCVETLRNVRASGGEYRCRGVVPDLPPPVQTAGPWHVDRTHAHTRGFSTRRCRRQDGSRRILTAHGEEEHILPSACAVRDVIRCGVRGLLTRSPCRRFGVRPRAHERRRGTRDRCELRESGESARRCR